MTTKRLATLLLLGLIALPPAWADKGGAKADRGHHRGHGHPEHLAYQRKGPSASISVEQRGIIQDYYHREYLSRRSCPPGLAKKGNGCLPPGQATKRWAVGQPLPAGVLIRPLPPELVVRLGMPPSGYGWGYADGNIMMYALVGRMVVDVVDALF